MWMTGKIWGGLHGEEGGENIGFVMNERRIKKILQNLKCKITEI